MAEFYVAPSQQTPLDDSLPDLFGLLLNLDCLLKEIWEIAYDLLHCSQVMTLLRAK